MYILLPLSQIIDRFDYLDAYFIDCNINTFEYSVDCIINIFAVATHGHHPSITTYLETHAKRTQGK
jgi:adenylate cyclase